jgi:SH3-like domain-containing protein
MSKIILKTVFSLQLSIKGGQMKSKKRISNLSKPLIIIVFVIVAFNAGVLIQPAMAERKAISSNRANIRSGPGTTYEVLWQVERYYPIEIIRTVGQWYKFKDFEGDIGWVKNTIVNSTLTVITSKENTVNVRKGPGVNYEKVFMVEKGVPFKLVQKKGNWLQIEHADGDKGWIFKGLVW